RRSPVARGLCSAGAPAYNIGRSQRTGFMAVLDIVKYPDPRLRETTFEVREITDDIRQLVRDLVDTMYSLNAAGIAAIQVGRLERVFIIDGKVAGGDDKSPPLVFINPEL